MTKLLGILIESWRMEWQLPEDKVQDLHLVFIGLREPRKSGYDFACHMILMGRVFCRRLAMATAGAAVPSHFVFSKI